MNKPVENILQHFFQTDSLQHVSVQQIQQLINEHPYYDAAYFLLVKKLYASKEQGYETAMQNAALHFSNELWVHYNLNEADDEVNIIEQEGEQPETSIPGTEYLAGVIEGDFAEERIFNKAFQSNNTIAENENINEEEIEDAVDENYYEADFPVNEKLSSLLQQQAADFEKPVETEAEIPVENTPYHRVDYFDSQGIKLEEKPDDKLGTQLRRFTDWLKQMKNINSNPANLGSDEAGEAQVQNSAQHSNEPEEIVTETMAEVLIKQGKPEQAIEIYEKLSFNNPSKTAYFAAKIAELKD